MELTPLYTRSALGNTSFHTNLLLKVCQFVCVICCTRNLKPNKLFCKKVGRLHELYSLIVYRMLNVLTKRTVTNGS